MKDTSECPNCKWGKLVKRPKEKPNCYIRCSLKKKDYSYGQRLECVEFEEK